MKTSSPWPWLLSALVFTQVEPALANGRFPRAERLVEHPEDPQQLLLAATYGILSSTDGGGSWRHICESSFGVVPVPADPLLEVSSSGVLGGLLQGVTLSEDGGCDFRLVFGGGDGQTIPDISVDKSERSRVLGLSKHQSGVTVVSELHESLDGGANFERVGEPFKPELEFDFPLTVDSAPSDPARIYVSGVSGSNMGQVLRSSDGGLSWEPPLLLSGVSFVNSPFIAAVDPHRADLLFVRTNGRELVGEQVWANDSLFIGDLTGEEGCALVPGFCEVFRVRAKLFGFALSPEGDHVLLGLGDPQDPAFQVDARFVGLYSGTAADLLAATPGGAFPPPGFKRVHSSPVSCVTWTTNGIYVCTSQAEKGFALGFAPDLASLESDELTPLLDLTAVLGPLTCPAETTTSLCGSDWQTTCQDLGACGNEPGPGGAGGADPSGHGGAPEPSGGSDSSTVGGAPSSVAGRPSSGASSVDTSTPSPVRDDGCSCRLASPPTTGVATLSTLALLLLIGRRRATRLVASPAQSRRLPSM